MLCLSAAKVTVTVVTEIQKFSEKWLQGLKLWASSVQKGSTFTIGLVVAVTWASSNKHFQPTI